MTDTPTAAPFPSLSWMHAYAAVVDAHPQAPALRQALAGRFRFVVEADRLLAETHTYDLLVLGGDEGRVEASEATQEEALLVIVTGYGRWKKLLTGKADIILYFLTRRLRIEGDVMALRDQLRDARPLLECLKDTPTAFVV